MTREVLSEPDACVMCGANSIRGEVFDCSEVRTCRRSHDDRHVHEVGWCVSCWMRQTFVNHHPLRVLHGGHAA